MSYHPETVNIAGYSVLGLTTIASGIAAVADIPPAVSAVAGNNAITVAVLTIATILVNGIIADRKGKRETSERLATSEEATERKVEMAKIEADRKLLEAKAESDRRVAALEARIAMADQIASENADARHAKMDRIYTMINRLYVHAQISSDAINTLIPAVQENSARVGAEVPNLDPVDSPVKKPSTL
jgi:hypothetical protein